MTSLTNTLAAVAALDAAANRLIAANAANTTALAQAQADLANADDTVLAVVQPVLDKVATAAPAPVVDDSAAASASADSGMTGDAAPSGDTSTAEAAPAA